MKHPKKMQDISAGIQEESIDTRDKNALKEAQVISSGEDIFSDMSSGEGKTLSFAQTHSITVDKKRGKHFDALEKRGAFSSFFQMKSVNLQKKKEVFSLTPARLKVQRYIKNLSTIGLVIAGFFTLLALVFFGYLDKIFVENRVNSGYQKLLDIREGNLGLYDIQKKVNNARFDLLLADVFFTPFSLFSGEKINSVTHVIAGGKYLSKSLDDMLSLTQKIQDFTQEKPIGKIYFTQLFVNIYEELKSIQEGLHLALENYEAISWLPNQNLEEKRQGNIIKIEKILSYLDTLVEQFPGFLELLGHSERKRYLIVFQNADEIRPTGGFMGSMGLLEIFRGQVQLFQKKDVYAIEWDLKKSQYERLPAPKGLDELTDTFGLRDANYYSNLKDSSTAIKFFTDRAGIQIDGIVYINQNILLRLLEITGPVYFPELKKDITAENFSEIMSLVVEAKSFQEGTLGTPKQVLFDFIEVFSKKLMADGDYFDYLQSLVQDTESRDIMMWSFHETEQKLLADMGLDGSIDYDVTLDSVYPVYTSLSGNKSDRYMQRKYRQSIKTTQTCAFDVQLEIQSTHDMGKKKREGIENLITEYQLNTPNLLEIQGADRNRQFVRIVLPPTAKILPQKDMEIVSYGTRTGVEFFLDTQLQQTSFFTLNYTLPNTQCKPYTYTFYKQAGIPDYDMILDYNSETFSYPDQQKDFFFEKR